MKFGVLKFALCASGLAVSCTCQARVTSPKCNASLSDIVSDKLFREHPVRVGTRHLSVVPPLVRTGKAHHYREAITEGAKDGPDFAGHYTIIPIGCGAATNCIAIADAISGRIYFPPELDTVEALLVDTGKLRIRTLNYRRDSRLLVAIGMPNEQRGQAGVGYYVWQSGRLHLVRFIPAAKLCGLPKSTQF